VIKTTAGKRLNEMHRVLDTMPKEERDEIIELSNEVRGVIGTWPADTAALAITLALLEIRFEFECGMACESCGILYDHAGNCPANKPTL
jgi:hypothetical protein